MSQGTLTINSISMSTPGWKVLDLSPLWGPPDLRGQNVVIPGTAGRHVRPRRVDETVYQLPMVIYHGFNVSGTPYADPSNGLQTNVEYLYAQLVSASLTSTVSATLVWPSSTSKTAAVQCQLQLSDHYGNSATRAVLYLTVPAGRFA